MYPWSTILRENECNVPKVFKEVYLKFRLMQASKKGNPFKLGFSLLVALLITVWPPVGSSEDNVTQQDTTVITTAGLAAVPALSDAEKLPHQNSDGIAEIGDYVGMYSAGQSPPSFYVTPDDPAVRSLAAQIGGPEDAYQVAVQWTYVSEQRLNRMAEKWLTPGEFLNETPRFASNPAAGEEASDCEEQANTLVSLFRALGVRPEEVRVALGEVRFDEEEAAHAWVELLIGGQWLALDPSSGPYWDAISWSIASGAIGSSCT